MKPSKDSNPDATDHLKFSDSFMHPSGDCKTPPQVILEGKEGI